MLQSLLGRQDDLSCPQIDGETIATQGQSFKVKCDWVLFNGNCTTYTGVEDCIDTCLNDNGCVVVTINSDWEQGCCIPSGLDGQSNSGWITAWNLKEVPNGPLGLTSSKSVTGTITSSSSLAFTILSSASSSYATSSSLSLVSSTSTPSSTWSSAGSSTSSLGPGPTVGATHPPTELSTGAQAGIGVGVGIIGLAVVAGALYLAVRFGKREQRYAQTKDESAMENRLPRVYEIEAMTRSYGRSPLHEMDGRIQPAEVAATERRFELDGMR